MSRPEQRAATPRRAVLGAGLAGSVLGLTGCGIRVEKGAPKIPGIKTQAPPADQAVLRRVLTNVQDAAASASRSSFTWAPALARIHRAQHRRLLQVMATQGMTPTPTPSATSTRVLAVEPTPLPALEEHQASQLGDLVDLTTRNLPMAAAIGVTHAAAAQLLGKPATPSGDTVPRPTQVPAAVLPSLQAAIYAFEVIVAKTPLDTRKKAQATLSSLLPTRAAWEAALGDAAPAQPDGYTLPVQPTTKAKRAELAQVVLTDLIEACAGQVSATRGDRASFIGLTGLWGTGTAQLWRWGATPTPFPGLA